jgi:DNA-binding NarL/FixJ family response regulator
MIQTGKGHKHFRRGFKELKRCARMGFQLASEGTMKLARVILADDHKILVEAFRKLLEPHFEVVAAVSDGRALLDVAATLKPDVILLDIGMPLLNGLEAARQLKTRLPAVKLIFLTMHEDPDLAIEAMRAGASGFLLKTSASAELLHAIHEALKGRTYVTPHISKGMEKSFIRDPRGRQRPKSLTPRQCEVVQLLAEGKSMKEIADVLHVTPRTVAFHKYRTMEELALKSTAELIQFAIKNHIVVV